LPVDVFKRKPAPAQTLGFSGSASAQFIQAQYQLLLARVPSALPKDATRGPGNGYSS
jgi:hypothetical protein